MDTATDALLGQTIGRYRLEALIGQGTSAAVYRARDLVGGDPVALRVFARDAAADQAFGARFRNAAAAAAALRHPHILPILDFGEDGGRAYIARPYLAGGSLRGLLGAPLPLDRVVGLLRPIADALDDAHAHGVVHGDLKPGNLLLADDGRLLLADLGTAHALAARNSVVAGARGRHTGTPEYLSPEQALGLPPDGRTDLYALAVIAYEALTGRPPFRAAGPADTPRALLLRHLDTAPPPPSALNPAVGPALEAALLRALAKDPGARFPSGADFFAALLEAQADDAAAALAALTSQPAEPNCRAREERDAAAGPGSGEDSDAAPVEGASDVPLGAGAHRDASAPGRPGDARLAVAPAAAPHPARDGRRGAERSRRTWTPSRWCWWALVAYALVMTALAIGRGPDALAGGRRDPAPAAAVQSSPVASPVTPTSTRAATATATATFAPVVAPPTATATPRPSPSPTATATATARPAPSPTTTAVPPTATPSPVPPTPTATAPPFAATDRIGAGLVVNFRAGPGTDYAIVTTLAPGTPLRATGETATADGVLWRQFVLADGRPGWVRDLDVVPAGT